VRQRGAHNIPILRLQLHVLVKAHVRGFKIFLILQRSLLLSQTPLLCHQPLCHCPIVLPGGYIVSKIVNAPAKGKKKKEHFDYTISKHQKPRVPSESRCLFNGSFLKLFQACTLLKS